MALAQFFEKAALAASQILKDFDYSAFIDALNFHSIGIFFDASAASSPEGINSLELSVNLLARLYPKLVITSTKEGTDSVESHLRQIATNINPEIDVSPNFSDVEVYIIVGNTSLDNQTKRIYIGSDGWIAKISTNNPVGSGSTCNPFGAGAAACFGAANIFRIIFSNNIPGGDLDKNFTLSLFNYETEQNRMENPEIKNVNLDETHLVGLGAIGNGAIWSLARVPNLIGTLHLIDDERIDMSNCQRYILTSISNVDMPKVELAVNSLSSTKINAIPHRMTWGEYLLDRENYNLYRVGVAVDSMIDRCAIQASLPLWIVNAWTQQGDLGISRHNFIDDKACLMCLYFPAENEKAEDQIIAEAIGLPQSIREVRELLYSGEPINSVLLTRIGEALHIPIESIQQFAGKPLRVFYSKAICGGMILSLGGEYQKTSEVEVPMAFQSVLAGIMLASELVAHAGGLKQGSQPTITKIDLLHPIGAHLSFDAKKHSSGICICQDPDFISSYKEKYL